MDNRKIDVLVAKEIFGLDVEPSSNYDGWYGDLIPIGDRMFVDPQGWVYDKGKQAVPCYSTNISSAWEVVEWIRQNGYIIKFWSPNGGPYKGQWEVNAWKRVISATGEDDPEMRAVFEDTEEIGTGIDMAPAATAPLAICLAALKLKGIEVEDEQGT